MNKSEKKGLNWENNGQGPPSEEEIKEMQQYCGRNDKYHICPFLNERIKNRERFKKNKPEDTAIYASLRR